MITGEIKNKIDAIWDTFWTGGITNSISVSSFIGSNVLSSMQEEYLKTIITYVSSNGDITPATLVKSAVRCLQVASRFRAEPYLRKAVRR